MILKFQKYQGAGNDFIIIDNRYPLYDFPAVEVEKLCHRKFGIGADGLMLLENDRNYDFRMRYFNSDGKEASMCGNGGRCIVHFAHSLGIFENTTQFIAADGVHEANLSDDTVRLKMQNVAEIISAPGYFFVNTGSPHYVEIVPDAFQINVSEKGKAIRDSSAFQPEGTNVNFITPTPTNIRVTTYERGVEAETLACGTGCVASALVVAFLRKDAQNTYNIQTKGGNLKVSFKQSPDLTFSDIWLEGPAKQVFCGEIEIK